MGGMDGADSVRAKADPSFAAKDDNNGEGKSNATAKQRLYRCGGYWWKEDRSAEFAENSRWGYM